MQPRLRPETTNIHHVVSSCLSWPRIRSFAFRLQAVPSLCCCLVFTPFFFFFFLAFSHFAYVVVLLRVLPDLQGPEMERRFRFRSVASLDISMSPLPSAFTREYAPFAAFLSRPREDNSLGSLPLTDRTPRSSDEIRRRRRRQQRQQRAQRRKEGVKVQESCY